MSLLERSEQVVARSVVKANRLRNTPKQLFTNLLLQWEQGISLIWDDTNPQAIFDELGADGVELYALSSALADFLESQKAGCTAAGIAKIRPFTVVDGKIVITP